MSSRHMIVTRRHNRHLIVTNYTPTARFYDVRVHSVRLAFEYIHFVVYTLHTSVYRSREFIMLSSETTQPITIRPHTHTWWSTHTSENAMQNTSRHGGKLYELFFGKMRESPLRLLASRCDIELPLRRCCRCSKGAGHIITFQQVYGVSFLF